MDPSKLVCGDAPIEWEADPGTEGARAYRIREAVAQGDAQSIVHLALSAPAGNNRAIAVRTALEASLLRGQTRLATHILESAIVTEGAGWGRSILDLNSARLWGSAATDPNSIAWLAVRTPPEPGGELVALYIALSRGRPAAARAYTNLVLSRASPKVRAEAVRMLSSYL